MAYCNAADVDKVFHEPSITRAMDDDASGAEDTGVVDAMIEEASGDLWGHIKKQYASLDPDDVTDVTSLTQVPGVLRRKTARLAAYYVLARQGSLNPQLRDDVLDWAKAVGDGEILLNLGTTRVAKSTTDGVRRQMAPKGELRHFGEATPGDVDATEDNDFFTTGEANE